MFTLNHLSSPPPEVLKSQIMSMVVAGFTDLSPLPLTASNLLYPLYQYVIGYEVHLYLASMDGAAHQQAQLIVALDEQDPLKLLGFALYLPSPDDTPAASLRYVAVCPERQGQGIGRALLARLTSLHPHVELACAPEKVDFFAKQGFNLLASQDAQVLMNTRRERSNGLFAVQDLAPIFQTEEVRQIYEYLVKQHGRSALQEAESLRDQLFAQQQRRAQALTQRH